MQINLTTLRKRIQTTCVVAVLLAMGSLQAHATNKDMVELQTQVQQLLDMVQRLQSTMDTKFALVQHLAEQTADNANQMTAAVTALQQKLNTQNDAITGKLDTSSGQVQSLNDSVDELKSRITKLDKAIQDLQSQLQTMQQQAAPTTTPGDSSAPNSAAAPAVAPPAKRGSGKPSAGVPLPPPSIAPGPSATDQGANQAPPLQETYQAGVRDYNAAKYDVAAGEFMDVIHYYPLDDLAGSAQFYLGEVAYHHQSYADAVKAYNAVLEGFSGSTKAPAAQLHKGLALLLLNKKESGIHELRLLIQRHPQTPEAAQARTKLKSMNVTVAGR
jgi:TolA-binding protein